MGIIEKIRHSGMLYKGAGYLFSMHLVASAAGFVFWALAARMYTPEHVGFASTLISVMGLLSTLSAMGLGFGLMRYLPQLKDEGSRSLVGTSFTLAAISALLFSMGFLIVKELIIPPAAFLLIPWGSAFLFTLYLVATNISWIMDSTFVGQRIPKYAFVKNSLIGVAKILLVLPLAAFGAFGLFSSYALPIALLSVFGLAYLLPKATGYYPKVEISMQALRETLGFSLANYLTDIFFMLPNFVFPIMVIRLFSPESTAYFYIAWVIANVFYTLPISVSHSFMVEASKHKGRSSEYMDKSFRVIMVILVPIVVLIFLFGKELLSFFGEGYSANSTELLFVLTLAGIPYALNRMYTFRYNVKNQVRRAVILNAVISTGAIGLSYPFMGNLGIVGIGYAWIVAQTLVAVGATLLHRSSFIKG